MATDLFYPDYYSETEKEEIRRSYLWPTLLNLHHAAHGKLFIVGRFVKGSGNSDFDNKKTWEAISMAIESGFLGLRITHNINSEIKIFNTVSPTEIKPSQSSMIESKNSRYIATQINDRGKPIAKSLAYTIASVPQYPIQMLGRMADRFSEQLCKHEYTRIEFDNDQREQVLHKLFAGIELPDNTLSVLKTQYDKQVARYKEVNKFKIKATEMFAKDKWIAIYAPDLGVIIGAADMTPLVGIAVQESLTGSSKYPMDFNMKLPFKLYRSVDVIDPVIKDEVLSKLTFCKVHREGSKIYKTMDPEGLFPEHDQVLISEETSSISCNSTPTKAVWILADQ